MTSKPSDEREQRLNDVLLQCVLELEAGREPDLEQLCETYPDLREDLVEFLATHEKLNRLAGHLPASPPGLVKPETQLGDFRLVREVGRGGMGVVYEAEQISLKRRVALKILPFAAALDERQLQRFKNEALAAAQMDHPHIVSAYAVGCERGVHYFAMQYVEGQSLAALLRELRGPAEQPAAPEESTARAELTSPGGKRHFDWVARLGRQAALALEHAHQTGVVHRDVKPSNLLLDSRGALWVSDFGLAQTAGEGNLTETGEILGTLRYASPEQLLARRGIVDHRTDIYSLGATLYELLTLRPVHDCQDRRELLRRICDQDPIPPRAHNGTIPVELETIVLKALRKEPQDRYATAEEFAEDLARYLENRPVLARRPTAWEKLRKWGARHPAALAASLLLLAALTLGSLISAALIRAEQARALAAHRRAEEALLRERERAEAAEREYRLARRSVDALIQVTERELPRRPGTEILRKQLLTSALAYYQEVAAERQDDPRAQAELSRATRRVERILENLEVLRAASRIWLLGQPAVLDDLRATDAQRLQIQACSARMLHEWRDSLRDAARLDSAERGRRAVARARANEAEINGILTPEQQTRLAQIGLQLDGPGAFRDPDVAAVLRLTSRQREAIRRIEDEALLESSPGAWPGSGANHARHRVRRPAGERVLEVLTPEQQERWRQLAGEPLRFGPGAATELGAE